MQKTIINGYIRNVYDDDHYLYYIFVDYSSQHKGFRFGTTHNKKEAYEIASDIAKRASQLENTQINWITVERGAEQIEIIARWTISHGQVRMEGEI